jgi:ferric-dicitrate binding protein FerR (iron transport regulator)
MDKVIYKYLNNNANLQEKKLLLKWLNESRENKIKFSRIKQLYSFALLTDEETGSSPDLSFLTNYIAKKESRNRIFRIAVKYSAAAVIATVIFALGLKTGKELEKPLNIIADEIVQMEYSTPYGVKGKIVLPDSSVVWLNSGSKIGFPSKFTGDSRNITFNGEAYFDVKKDTAFPMRIKTSHNFNVVVTGTSFNLHSYREDPFFSLYLSKGRVNIQDKKGNVIHMLKEDESVEYNFRANEIKSRTAVEPSSIVGWKNGWLIFDEEELKSVFRKMERWYGISFKICNNFNLNNKLTAKFREESASQVLDLMKKISLINYSIKDSVVFITIPK